MSYQHCTILVSVPTDSKEDRETISKALRDRFDGVSVKFVIVQNQFAHVDEFTCEGGRFPGATVASPGKPDPAMPPSVLYLEAEEVVTLLSMRNAISTP
jgi:hypothetical protein